MINKTLFEHMLGGSNIDPSCRRVRDVAYDLVSLIDEQEGGAELIKAIQQGNSLALANILDSSLMKSGSYAIVFLALEHFVNVVGRALEVLPAPEERSFMEALAAYATKKQKQTVVADDDEFPDHISD